MIVEGKIYDINEAIYPLNYKLFFIVFMLMPNITLLLKIKFFLSKICAKPKLCQKYRKRLRFL